MDGVTVDGMDLAFLVILENDITPERTGTDNVLDMVSIKAIANKYVRLFVLTHSVCHDITILLIHNKAGGLA